MHVSELWVYPIKSCRGIPVDEFRLDDRGPEHDRRWMLVDASGQFLTQRQYPRLALIDVALDGEHIRVSAPGVSALSVRPDEISGAEVCRVWRDTVELERVSVEADAWFTDFLGIDCRLMRMPRASERVIDRHYSPKRRLVSLADGYPMLLIGTGSLELLNEKLDARGEPAVPMRRFRPNVIIAGTRPHEEDEWHDIRIGAVDCRVVKPCARCVTTTVDIDTGVPGNEPLRTLATYRKHGSKVLFGQNLIHEGVGTIRRGDGIITQR